MSELTPFDVAKQIMEKNIFLTLEKTEEIYIYKEGVYCKQGDTSIKKRVQEILEDKATTHKVNEVINHIKRMTLKDVEDDAVPIDFICVKNGILNIYTRELKPHSPNVIFFNKLPVKYNPNAQYTKFKNFVEELVSKNDAETLQEFGGYCLRRDTAYQKGLMLYGRGDNGKSTLTKIWEAFFGKQNHASIPLQQLEEDKFIVANLREKMVNIFADLPSKALYETSITKTIITGDSITAQRKFGHPFNFIPHTKLIFSCNRLPETKDMSSGWFRRWIIIKFCNTFRGNAQSNKELEFMNEEDMSSILNWALDGLDRLKETDGFLISERETREIWMKYSDNVSAFIQDDIVKDVNSYLTKEELYERYTSFCEKQGSVPLDNNAFHRKLKEKIEVIPYQPSIDGKQVHAWKGIRFEDAPPW